MRTKHSLWLILPLTLLLPLTACSEDFEDYDDYIGEEAEIVEGSPTEETVDAEAAASLVIVNTSSVEVCDVSVTSNNAEEWGPNVLDTSLLPGDSLNLSYLNPGQYDFLAMDCADEGNTVDEQYGITLGDGPVVWNIASSVDTDTVNQPVPAQNNTEALPVSDDLRRVDFGQLPGATEVTITLESGDASFLFFARSSDLTEYISITQIAGPDGSTLYALDTASYDVGGVGGFDEPLEGVGEVALVMPRAPQFPIQPGDYVISVETETGSPISTAGAIIRSSNVDGPQALDLNFWLVSNNPEVATPEFQATMAEGMRREIDNIISPHNLKIGNVNFFVGSAADIDRFSTTELDENTGSPQLAEGCMAMDQSVGASRALNLVVIEGFYEPTDPEAGESTSGIATGTPGAPMVAGSPQSCVFIALVGDYDWATNTQGLNTIHEGAHLLGLPHTTEEDGNLFDYFQDTAECQVGQFDSDGDGIVGQDECFGADGSNYMFWEEGGLQMSADQAWVLRRHPLFYPAP